jgi:hypothetical protein
MNWSDKFSNDLLKILSLKFADGYSIETDLLNPKEKLESTKIFPEKNSIDKIVIANGQQFDSYSPLAVVMMMEPVRRPLLAVACRKLLKKSGNVSVINPAEISRQSYYPSLEQVIETAKEYNEKEIKSAIEEFNNCTARF